MTAVSLLHHILIINVTIISSFYLLQDNMENHINWIIVQFSMWKIPKTVEFLPEKVKKEKKTTPGWYGSVHAL